MRCGEAIGKLIKSFRKRVLKQEDKYDELDEEDEKDACMKDEAIGRDCIMENDGEDMDCDCGEEESWDRECGSDAVEVDDKLVDAILKKLEGAEVTITITAMKRTGKNNI